jgi:hypothetical protein
MRVVGALAALTLALVGCTAERAQTLPPAPSPPALETPDALEMPDEPVQRPGRSATTTRRIARQVEAEYPLVEVWRAEPLERGRVVVYGVRFRLDDRTEHPEFEDWNAHVRRAARDQREAAVTMLQRTVGELRRVRLVSVYQDRLLQPYWSRPQIEAMDEPTRYRRFEVWQDLVLSAALLPGRPGSVALEP